MKYVVFLGGGINQLPYIEAAKTKSLFTIVIDQNPYAVAKHIADIFINESIENCDAILKLISKFNISHIFLFWHCTNFYQCENEGCAWRLPKTNCFWNCNVSTIF